MASTEAPQVQEDDIEALRARVRELEQEVEAAHQQPAISLSDEQALQEIGIYRYHHPLENSDEYKASIKALNDEIDTMARSGDAVLASDLFTWNGSLNKGRKLVDDLRKLMLRAYNAEADNCARALRSGNSATAIRRLERSRNSISKLASLMELRINPDYHALRVRELELIADHQMKLQLEREEAREQRAQLREQRRAEAELEAERERLEKERIHYVTALKILESNGDTASIEEMRGRLKEINAAITSNDYRRANIRAGYVYVISNIGSFGPGVVKIGMTRRLEPRDRVRELGGASVPFLYDTHVLYFSKDAVGLEAELHREFANRRVNWVNSRREFFFASPEEVRTVLNEKVGGLLEYISRPEALEFYQSVSLWPQTERPKI